MLNFTRSWGFGIFRVYWVSKSKCIISSNLRAEGSWGKVLNVVIFVESVVHRSNWRSRETETVGNSRKQSEKNGLRGKLFFAKNWLIDNLGMITPGRSRLFPTVSDCFRLFPTVSDCFRLFQFLWNASWTCGPLIQQKSQHSTLFLTTLLRAGCSKWCILTLKPNKP